MEAPDIQQLNLYRHPELPDWLIMEACFRRHQTIPHASGSAILMACPDGLEHFALPDWQGPVPAGSLVLLPAELIHSDRSGWQSPRRIQVLYLPAGELPATTWLMEQNPLALQRFSAWCQAFAQGAGAAALRVQLQQLMADLSLQPLPADWQATPDQVPELSELARQQGLSKAAALRAFRRHWGCTPDQYRRQRQLRQAAHLIQAGQPLVQVALASGFWDQSHLTRHFMGIYGVTPGVFRQRNCVQDRP